MSWHKLKQDCLICYPPSVVKAWNSVLQMMASNYELHLVLQWPGTTDIEIRLQLENYFLHSGINNLNTTEQEKGRCSG